MKKAFVYTDEKSNKFWTVNYSGHFLCVHYGKIDTVGKFEIKEFDSIDKCEKEAKRLIASKMKKGYKENINYDFENCIYIDTVEYGPHPMTSHPRFSEHFTDEFYYDCGDEEAPFGSDEGSDILHIIEDCLRKKRTLDFSAFPKKIITEWQMEFIPINTLTQDVLHEMSADFEKRMNIEQSDIVTYATAFAQIKTTGKLNSDLKENALLSLKRLAIIYSEGKLTSIQQKMYNDLSSFENCN